MMASGLTRAMPTLRAEQILLLCRNDPLEDLNMSLPFYRGLCDMLPPSKTVQS